MEPERSMNLRLSMCWVQPVVRGTQAWQGLAILVSVSGSSVAGSLQFP